MLLHPAEFHWDKHSSLPATPSLNLNKLSTSKSIPEMGGSTVLPPKVPGPHEFKLSLLNISTQKTSDNTTNLSDNLKNSISQRSLNESNGDMFPLKRGEDPEEEHKEKTPVYLLTVNSKNQLVYSLLFKDSCQIEGEMEDEFEVVYEFDEIITNMLHLDSEEIILLCGSPHLFFWSVSAKRVVFKHKIVIPVEPWFSIWDSLYIKSKQSLILGLNNGLVLQLKFNISSLVLEDMKIFQSNEEGLGVFSLTYFPSIEKILATNNLNTLTEFVFQIPRKGYGKAFYMPSSKNISMLKESKTYKMKSNSIRNISLFETPQTFKIIASSSTKKNQ